MFSSAHTDDKCQATTVPRARLERLPTEDFLLNEMGKDPFRDRSLSSTNRTDTSGAEWIHKVVLAVLTAVSLGLVCMNYMTACDGTLAANSSDLGSELGVKAASMLQLKCDRQEDVFKPSADPKDAFAVTVCKACNSHDGDSDKGCSFCHGTGYVVPTHCTYCFKGNHVEYMEYMSEKEKLKSAVNGELNFCSDYCSNKEKENIEEEKQCPGLSDHRKEQHLKAVCSNLEGITGIHLGLIIATDWLLCYDHAITRYSSLVRADDYYAAANDSEDNYEKIKANATSCLQSIQAKYTESKVCTEERGSRKAQRDHERGSSWPCSWLWSWKRINLNPIAEAGEWES